MITAEDMESMKCFDTVGEYSEWVESMMFTKGKDRLVENTLGLVGEAGEVAEKVKKQVRDGVFNRHEVAKELGDVLWYLANISNDIGYSLKEIANMNVDKLRSRKERDVIKGSGDNR